MPHEVERATILLAGSISSTPAHSNAGGASSERVVRAVQAGSARVQFDTSQSVDVIGVDKSAHQGLEDNSVVALVRRWLKSSQSVGKSVAYGTDAASQFTDANRYGRNEGFA